MLMMVLASAGTGIALCEAICVPAAAPAHHTPQGVTHAHGAHASEPASAVAAESGCKTLAQISLLRRRETASPALHQFAVAPLASTCFHNPAVARDQETAARADHPAPPGVFPVPLRV